MYKYVDVLLTKVQLSPNTIPYGLNQVFGCYIQYIQRLFRVVCFALSCTDRQPYYQNITCLNHSLTIFFTTIKSQNIFFTKVGYTVQVITAQ